MSQSFAQPRLRAGDEVLISAMEQIEPILPGEVEEKVPGVPGVESVEVELVWDPVAR